MQYSNNLIFGNETIGYRIYHDAQQIVNYQFVKLAACLGSLSHHQADSQSILKVHSVDVHVVGSQMFTDHMTIKGTNDC
jgi:hypothetical protein